MFKEITINPPARAKEGEGVEREEHMNWCKKRALDYVEARDNRGAFCSVASDLNKHLETAGHIGMSRGMTLIMSGGLKTKGSMKKYIEDFN